MVLVIDEGVTCVDDLVVQQVFVTVRAFRYVVGNRRYHGCCLSFCAVGLRTRFSRDVQLRLEVPLGGLFPERPGQRLVGFFLCGLAGFFLSEGAPQVHGEVVVHGL
ncbi:hypothetical protein MTO96_013047 [Rhipicephalus appendiculatus]